MESKPPRKLRPLCIRETCNDSLKPVFRSNFFFFLYLFSSIFFSSFFTYLFLFTQFYRYLVSSVFVRLCGAIIIHCCDCEFRTIIVSRSLRSVSNTNEGLQVPLAFFVTRSPEGRHSSNRLICSRFSLFLSTVLAPYPTIRRCGQNNFLLIYNGILEATVL